MTKPLSPPGRVAVIGAGAFGRFSTQAYLASGDVRVEGVADPDASARLQLSETGVRLQADWRALMADPSIECVHLATPPFLRKEVVEAAFAAGKSVFCEKPLALTLNEADQMIADSRRAGVGLGVDYVMRFQPAYRFLWNLNRSGLAGEVRSISFQNFAQNVPPDHWFWNRECSGGILVEHGVHFFDAYGRLVGRPVRVAGRAPSRRSVDVTVWYESSVAGDQASSRGPGVIGRYYHEFAFPKEIEHAGGVVMFERGRILIEGWIPTRLSARIEADPALVETVLRDSGIESGVTHEENIWTVEAVFPDREASYAGAIIGGMRDLVRKHRDPQHTMLVTPEEARLSLAVALAAQRATDSRNVLDIDGTP